MKPIERSFFFLLSFLPPSLSLDRRHFTRNNTYFTAHREIDRFFSVSDRAHHLMDAWTGSVTLIGVSFEHRLMETLVSQFVRIREFMDQSVYLNKLHFIRFFIRAVSRMRGFASHFFLHFFFFPSFSFHFLLSSLPFTLTFVLSLSFLSKPHLPAVESYRCNGVTPFLPVFNYQLIKMTQSRHLTQFPPHTDTYIYIYIFSTRSGFFSKSILSNIIVSQKSWSRKSWSLSFSTAVRSGNDRFPHRWNY